MFPSAQEQRRFQEKLQAERVYVLPVFLPGSIRQRCSLSHKGDQLLWGQLGPGWLIVESQMSMTNADLHADCLSALFRYLFISQKRCHLLLRSKSMRGNKEDVILLPIHQKKKEVQKRMREAFQQMQKCW